jgi:peptidoglycan/xylan/chitin deacetylase (PgdA/CDA1 family)
LSWNDLTELSKDRLVSFGCHAHTHRNLARLPPEEALQDILRSKELIAEKLGRRCRHFSYPFGNVGSYNHEIKKMLRKIGFHSAVTTRRGLNRSGSDPFEIRRIVVRDDSSYVFKCSLIGLTLQR